MGENVLGMGEWVPLRCLECEKSAMGGWDWGWVDQVYCINLRERPDRFLESAAEFHKVGLCNHVLFYRPERPTEAEWQYYQCSLIEAKKQDPIMTVTKGAYGCWKSHKAVAEHALQNGHQRILVFEDDVAFLDTLTPTNCMNLHELIGELPDDADFFHLGYFPYTGYPIFTENYSSFGSLWCVKALCTVAYVATTRGMQLISRADVTVPLDFWMVQTAKQYAVFPKVAWQRKSQTDVEELWLGCPATGIKLLGNVFYRGHQRFVDTLMLIVLPILAVTFLLLMLLLVARKLRASLQPSDPPPFGPNTLDAKIIQ